MTICKMNLYFFRFQIERDTKPNKIQALIILYPRDLIN